MVLNLSQALFFKTPNPGCFDDDFKAVLATAGAPQPPNLAGLVTAAPRGQSGPVFEFVVIEFVCAQSRQCTGGLPINPRARAVPHKQTDRLSALPAPVRRAPCSPRPLQRWKGAAGMSGSPPEDDES